MMEVFYKLTKLLYYAKSNKIRYDACTVCAAAICTYVANYIVSCSVLYTWYTDYKHTSKVMWITCLLEYVRVGMVANVTACE